MTTTRRIKAGTTDVSVVIRIIDSTDGTPETGVVFNTSGIDLEYRRELEASTDITEATLAALTTAHSDGGFLHVGNGYYRLDLPDAACAAGATGVLVHGIVTGMVVIGTYIELVAYDPYDTVRLGLTALPNAVVNAANGLYTRGTGAGQINQPANGLIDVNVENWNTTAVPAEHTAGYPIVTVKDGTGTGELDTASGLVLANVTQLGGVAQSLTDLKDFADDGYDPSTNKVQGVVLTDTLTTYTGNTPQTGDSFARLGAPAGASVSADIAAIEAQTDDIGAAGAGLTAIPWNAAWDAEVESEANDALVAQNLDHLVKIAVDTDFPTTVHLSSVVGHLADNGTSATFDRTTDSLEAVRDRGDAAWITATGFSTLTQADIRTAVGLASANLDTQLSAIAAFIDTEITTILSRIGSFTGSGVNTVLGFFQALMRSDSTTPSDLGGTYDDATDSLQAIRDRGDSAWTTGTTPPTVGAIADAIWDETLADHLAVGSTGAGLNAASSAGDPWTTALPGAYGAGTAGKIIGDNINATISSRSTHAAADVWAVVTRVLTAGTNIVLAKGVGVTGFNDLSVAQVNAEVVDALNVDTYPEASTAPAATTTLAAKIVWLATLARNKITQTSTVQTLRNDADTGNVATAVVSDDTTTAIRGEWS